MRWDARAHSRKRHRRPRRRIDRAGRVALEHHGGSPEYDVGSLGSGRIRPANNSRAASSRMPSSVRATAWRPARKTGGRRRDAPPRLDRIGAIQLDDSLTFLGGVRDRRGAETHDLLAVEAGSARPITVGELPVLDLRHRVHRVDERDVPALAGDRADLTRQPVVRVDEIEVPRLPLNLGTQHIALRRSTAVTEDRSSPVPRKGPAAT